MGAGFPKNQTRGPKTAASTRKGPRKKNSEKKNAQKTPFFVKIGQIFHIFSVFEVGFRKDWLDPVFRASAFRGSFRVNRAGRAPKTGSDDRKTGSTQSLGVRVWRGEKKTGCGEIPL